MLFKIKSSLDLIKIYFKMIRRVLSSKKKCFVCLKKRYQNQRVKFFSVNRESIPFAYFQHKILIDNQSVCCSNHLDDNKCLTEQAFIMIKNNTKEITDRKSSKKSPNNDTCCLFDNFKNIDDLSEEKCHLVTGWTNTNSSDIRVI